MRLIPALLLLFAVLAAGCLKVPDDLTLVVEPFDGYRDGYCGFYGWQDNVIHIREECQTPEVRYQTILHHEFCHAHQDFSVESEFGQDLRNWESTEEGISYAEAIQGRGLLYYPAGSSLVEDFATACARYYVNRDFARESYPVRSEWMDENLAPFPPRIP